MMVLAGVPHTAATAAMVCMERVMSLAASDVAQADGVERALEGTVVLSSAVLCPSSLFGPLLEAAIQEHIDRSVAGNQP